MRSVLRVAGIGALLTAQLAWGGSPPQSRGEFCARIKNPLEPLMLARDARNHLSFRNPPGYLGIGLCWWHSRLQRHAFYLAVFRPDQPRPTRLEARRLVEVLKGGNQVVEIPGYRDLRSFSHDYKDEFERALSDWQIRDGTLGFSWMEGLLGRSDMPADELKQVLDRLYHTVTKLEHMSFLRIQLPGIATHALLVVEMKRRADGYEISVIDSNWPGKIERLRYRFGDTFLSTRAYARFAPYPARTREFGGYAIARARYCGQ